MKRRRFLHALAVVPAALAGACQTRPSPPADAAVRPAPAADSCQVAQRERGTGRVLTPGQWDTLEAACARLVPSDHEPGAREAGVINYIDGQLLYGPARGWQALLQAGAAALERAAAPQRFAALPAQGQDQALQQLAAGTAPDLAGHSGGRFIEVLLALTLEGLFCDPLYGGNRGGVGWRLIGHRPRQPAGRCAYPGLG